MAQSSVDLRVLPIQLKKARSEPLEEDVRRQALLKFRDIILLDPIYGNSTWNQFAWTF